MTTAVLTPDAVTYVCTLVRQRAAIELEAGKAYLIEARLTPVAKRNGYTSATDMVRALQLNPKPALGISFPEANHSLMTRAYSRRLSSVFQGPSSRSRYLPLLNGSETMALPDCL